MEARGTASIPKPLIMRTSALRQKRPFPQSQKLKKSKDDENNFPKSIATEQAREILQIRNKIRWDSHLRNPRVAGPLHSKTQNGLGQFVFWTTEKQAQQLPICERNAQCMRSAKNETHRNLEKAHPCGYARACRAG